MARNANGRSSIYEDADGVWHGWVTVGVKANGDPDRRHRRGKTRTEVTNKVKELERQRAEGVVADAGKIPTVAQWIRTWLSDGTAPGSVDSRGVVVQAASATG
jgi:hypothetical protein